ncbi:HWE histidine kinase domain-containing protein [Falsiroseomonas sp. CW058]|uniref:HWE histidine kinase domain-containing protein n=1 Tax=Falsiroseomonas sp. CW058 TaxID=3388664 RepID=UPI003D315A9E
MLADYIIWCGGVAIVAVAGTWLSLRVWNRWIRREEAQALALVRAMEGERDAHRTAEREAARALAASERRHRALTEAGAIAVWQAARDGRITALEGWTAFAGESMADVAGSAHAWLVAVVPEDRGRVSVAWSRAVADGRPLDVEFRVARADGTVRWCRARAVLVPSPGGDPDAAEWIGVVEDVDGRRRAEEARMLLAREVNHRAKNMLAVVQAVVRLTRAGDPESFAAAVSTRIAALGRAHDLLSRRAWGDVALDDLVRGELAPYLALPEAEGDQPPRVRISGPPLRLRPGAVQPLAIALHELAVNAAKYGALSAGSAGRVEVGWEVPEAAGAVVVTWREQGGPPLRDTPERRGFGTRVIDASIGDQLRGRVERSWKAEGLCCTLTIPLDRLHAEDEAEPDLRMEDPAG